MRVRTAGDIDGDGRSEFLVASYTGDPPARVWVCKYTGVGVQEEEALPARSRPMLEAWPNPCHNQVRFFCPPAAANSALTVCDVTGRVVRTLTIGPGASSRAPQEVVWDLRDDAGKRVGQGVYVIEMEQGNGNTTRHCSAKVIVERQ